MTIKKADTTLKLMKIDVHQHKPYELIQLGTATKLHVINYMKNTDFKESALPRFYKEVCMLRHSIETSPLNISLFVTLTLANMKSQKTIW